MENLLDPRNQNKNLKAAIKQSVEQMFPIEAGGKRVTISNVDIKDQLPNTDFPAQKEVKLQRKSWAMPIYGDVKIEDLQTGQVLSTKQGVKLGELPKITNRLSAIIDGNEYQVSNQFRRRSGVYSREKNTGELQSEFNLEKGSNFTLEIDPEKQIFVFKLRSGTRAYKLWTILNMLGVTDSEMEKQWGKNLLEINRAAALSTEESDLRDLFKKLIRREEMPGDMMKLRARLRQYFEETQMDGEVNEFTLGGNFPSANGAAILTASKKLLKISRGEEEQDSRDSLIYKRLLTPDDQLVEFFKGNHQVLEQRIKNQLTRRTEAREVIPAGLFSKPIRQFFTTADLSSTPPQTNPVAMIVNSRKTTPMGAGGIQSEHAITLETRDVDPTHMGFLDGLSTPEGKRVGVNLGLASGVVKIGKDIATPVYDNQGKIQYKTPLEVYKATVGLPDQFKKVQGKPVALRAEVQAMREGKPVLVSPKEVQFWIKSSGSLFDVHSNLVTFLPNTQGNRGSTAGRMITQALPLDNPQAPLSVSLLDEPRGSIKTYEDMVGQAFLPTLRDESGLNKDGVVTKIDKDYIWVKSDGKEYKIGMYNDFPLNEDGFMNTSPIVKVGDKVTPDQPLVKNNYTDDTGRLALGTNLTVAYLPYKGNSFEDGATITESAAKKLSHTTIHKETLFFNPKLASFSLKKFKAYYPNDLTPKNAAKLDEQGLPKIGQQFDQGDLVAAYLVKRELDNLDASLKKLNKALFTPFNKQVLTWDSEDPGVVTDIRRNGPYIDIYIKAVHPFKEGDKLCVSEDTEFYTNSGWKKLEDLRGSELFLTQDLATGKQRFAEALEVNIYDHTGPMFKIEGPGISQLVSPEHRVVCFIDNKWQLRPAHELAKDLIVSIMRYSESDPVKCFITQVSYNGKIGCPTTEDGVVFIRKDEVVSWTGNSSRYGDKHIVGKIIPDHEAPHREDGTPVDIMVNPAGVPGRMNVGQILDTAAGKIARVTGKPYEMLNFDPDSPDMARKILGEMQALGIEPNEKLRDGVSGDFIKNPIFVGERQYLKLRHIVDKKMSARSFGSYDLDEQPAGKGAQKVGVLETYAYLAHGAKNILHEAAAVRGQKNEEYFRRLQFGLPPGRPQKSFIFDKLINYMRVAGADVDKEGYKMQLAPLGDKRILEMSNGKITDPGMMLQGKNLAPKRGGLFDPEVLGGSLGNKFGHFDLPVRLPNPMAEVAIKSVLGLTNNQYDQLVQNDIEGLINRLEGLDVEAELEKTKEELKKAPVSSVNKLNTKVRILDALQKSGDSPVEAYTMSKILVVPPKFRPIIPLPSGDLTPADINMHYRAVGLNAKTLDEALKSDVLDDEDKAKYKYNLYKSVSEMQGFSEPALASGKKYRGSLADLGHTKRGLIFGKAWVRHVDLAGRSTIGFDPSLGLDEVGVPYPIAKEIFKPFAVKKMRESGYSASSALAEAKAESPVFNSALQQVMREKPVLLNRAPSLHKHSVQAFRPKLVYGKDIRLNPLITSGFNVDQDGDTMSLNVPVSYEAEQEARKMFPSQILFKHGDQGLVPSLSQDYAYGIVKLSELGPSTGLSFKTLDDAKAAKIDWTHLFKLGGFPGEVSIGQVELNKKLPEKYRDYKRVFTGSSLKKLLEQIAKEETPEVFTEVINHYKDLGPMYAYKHGATISITDLVFDRSWRDDLVKKYEPKIKQLKTDEEKVEGYLGLIDQIQSTEGEFFKKNYNNLYDLVDGGALSKSKGGNVRQVLTAPGIVADTRGKPIPMPIFKSYSEGLTTLDYFNTLPGVRKGVVDKGVNTQKSGALNKELLSVTRRHLIVEEDCGTTEGLVFEVDDTNVFERFAVETIKGVVSRDQLIDQQVVNKAKEAGVKSIKARSPLTCEASEGLCSLCYGLLPDGHKAPVGTNIGILEGQAISEKSTQLTLRSFHSGGAVGRGTDIMGAFPRLEQLVKYPENISGKATLAEKAGQVEFLEPNDIGGWKALVSGKEYTIQPGRKPVVQVGDKVKKGQKLSDGYVKPQELTGLSGLLDAQRYIVDEMNETYEKQFNKKTFETVVRAITDTAEVEDAPEDSGFFRGDKLPLSRLRALNKDRKAAGLQPVKFKEYIKGISTQNVDLEDWFSRITTNRVKDGLAKGVAKQQWANLAGRDPIPAYLYAEDFGRPDKKNSDGFY